MNKREARSRWKDTAFSDGRKPSVERLFCASETIGGDYRGLVIGEDGPLSLAFSDLQGKRLVDVDLSFSEVACPLIGAEIIHSSFLECDIHDSPMKGATISDSRFDGSVFSSVSFDDVKWKQVSLAKTKWKDRAKVACIGICAVFDRCDLTGATFEGVEFRAASFINCVFSGAQFKNCDFRGVKFQGSVVDDAQLLAWAGCDRATYNGAPWTPSV